MTDDPHGLYYCKATAEEIEDCKKFIVPAGITLTLTEEQRKIFAEPSSLKILTEWIDVKNKLPKTKDEVLTFVKSKHNMGFDKYCVVLRYQSDKWLDGNDCDGYQVTHWMPLPKNPEEIQEY